ncbi:Polysaccharide deacetylase [uncultured Sporomusa sp.]|uniref:Polysaccharide deacetylase n=1 Tax=uncultured Sporomusa sp. TaxID=307249 RepID=A0A212M1C5_9FIRM|nr:polysaccharide deacetylase family protein [uncultured Sporomusa sp.]SCM83613.1 Polysaccharide deacetylase [uncultured Sporomusa sp.]
MTLSVLDVPVLMYHKVNPLVIDRNTVHIDNFKQQLQYLAQSGYQTITLAQYQECLTGRQVLPIRPIILTFDDGYEDNFTHVLPLLKQYNMKGTIFVVAGGIGKPCSWLRRHECNQLMTWEQLNKWLEAGMEIGGHTMSHPMLSRLTDAAIRYELEASKELLEQELKTKIEFFCYPYGDLDDRVKTLAQIVGYKAGIAIFNNVSLIHKDIYAIPRVGISSRLPLWEFKLKVSRLYRCFIGMRKIESGLKRVLRRSHG